MGAHQTKMAPNERMQNKDKKNCYLIIGNEQENF